MKKVLFAVAVLSITAVAAYAADCCGLSLPCCAQAKPCCAAMK